MRSSYLYILACYLYGYAPFIIAIVLYIVPNKWVNFGFLIAAGICSLIFISKELFQMAKTNLNSKYLRIISFLMIFLHLVFIGSMHFAMI